MRATVRRSGNRLRGSGPSAHGCRVAATDLPPAPAVDSTTHRIGRRRPVSEIGKPQARSYFAAAQTFRDGTDTPRAFLERCIATIETLDPQVGAFVATNLPAARAAADAATARWKSRTTLSLIDGMPVGIKDIMETADMVTEQGSPLFAGWRGRRDAAAVAALREAGAVIIGKTVTTEFAATHPRGTRNPWDHERT